MKVKKSIFLVAILLLVNITTVLAQNPDPGTPGDTTTPGLPGEEDFPIDQNLVFLMIAGVGLGTLIICKNKTKKASM